jgi:exopolysaccharide biosynthesis polyprenyl glycosylphosphotransferase
MKNNASIFYALILVIGDALALVAAFSVAYILRVKFDTRPLIEQIPAFEFLLAFLVVLPLWLLVHALIGLYRNEVYGQRFLELGRLASGSIIGILVVIGYDFVAQDELFPARLVPVYGVVLSFVFLILFRTIARVSRRLLYKLNVGVSDILIVGDTAASLKLAKTIADTRTSGIRVVGIVGRKSQLFKHFSSFDDAVNSLNPLPHGIIQTELYKDDEINNLILQFSQQHHISYRFMPGNSSLFIGKLEVELFAGLPMIAVHQTALVGWGRVVKRLFDLAVSLIMIAVLSPLLIVIAVINKLTSGSVFFRQNRLTRFNSTFKVFKFRSQYKKYDGTTPEQAFEMMGKPELAKQYRKNGDYLPNDPRVTPFGRFLRASSLDELPQLFNVVKGDLSLVGPRALIPEELDTYTKKHTILSVKAGLTGLAQVSGRRDISFEERRRIDTYYVQNWHFLLDISILLKTIRVVLTGEGAK